MTGTQHAQPELPRYGQRSLAEVLPSVLCGLGVRGLPNPLDVPQARGVCLLLVDGLGWELLDAHRGDAPFLHSLADGASPLTAGFPSTTATSITSLGTGNPSGSHGIVGYTFAPGAAGGSDGILNALSWRSHGVTPSVDLLDTVVPERLQPIPTMLRKAADAGIRVGAVAPAVQRESGLTRAALRGARFLGTHALGDLAALAVSFMDSPSRSLCYAYHGDLDMLGHMYGPGAPAWRMQLAHVDRLAAAVFEALPQGCLLVVIADHGMVKVTEADRIDVEDDPALREGVRMIGGEVRARHVYAVRGAGQDVLAAWRSVLGDRAWVATGEEAIASGWFGPTVRDAVRERIGDVVAAARGTTGIVRHATEPAESRLAGHHGSFTPAEQHVPFLLARR